MATLTPSARAIAMIEGFEIGSDQDYIATPCWPGGGSGLTIGIGYDLGYASVSDIASDWSALPNNTCQRLQSYAGLVGAAAKARQTDVADLSIPLFQARKVFEQRNIPRTTALTVRVFENAEALSPDSLGALVSLVFNRGASMIDTQPNANRREMREIRDAMTAGAYDAIPGFIRAMKRLWQGQGLNGLLTRRDAEADLFQSGLQTPTA